MDDIASEAGVSKATLYLHFDGKEAIFKALIDACRAQIRARTAAAETEKSTLQACLAGLLYAYFGTSLEWFGDSSYLRELYVVVKQDPVTFGPAADEDQLAARLHAVLSAAVRRQELQPARGLDVKIVARVLMDAATGAKRGGDIKPEDYRRRIEDATRVVLAALGGR